MKQCRDRFSARRMADEYEVVYRRVLDESRSRGDGPGLETLAAAG